MNKEECICQICTGSKSDRDIFRLINYYEKTVCEVCLQTVVAPASPKLFMHYVNDGVILYEDLRKEKEIPNISDYYEKCGLLGEG